VADKIVFNEPICLKQWFITLIPWLPTAVQLSAYYKFIPTVILMISRNWYHQQWRGGNGICGGGDDSLYFWMNL